MFRFTIRDLLWLTVVVALAVGWLVDHQRQAKSRADLWTQYNEMSREHFDLEFAVKMEPSLLGLQPDPDHPGIWRFMSDPD